MSREGIYTGPKKIWALKELKSPTNWKGVQSFFRKYNFVEIFIPDYASIINPINKLLKKDKFFDWTPEAQRAFLDIKFSIVSSPTLVSPNFDKHFILYSFSSKDTLVVIFTKKIRREKNFEYILWVKNFMIMN